ncbi:MAG TPA: hypothetical protein VLT35_05990 [Methanocella sp.]|nr:hypothetical protein [Methanocella sp.]
MKSEFRIVRKVVISSLAGTAIIGLAFLALRLMAPTGGGENLGANIAGAYVLIAGVAVAMFAAGAASAVLTSDERPDFRIAVRLSLYAGFLAAIPLFMVCLVLLLQGNGLLLVCLLATLLYLLLSVAGGSITFAALSFLKARKA